MTPKEVNGFAYLFPALEKVDSPTALSVLDPATSKFSQTLPNLSQSLLQNQVGYLLRQQARLPLPIHWNGSNS